MIEGARKWWDRQLDRLFRPGADLSSKPAITGAGKDAIADGECVDGRLPGYLTIRLGEVDLDSMTFRVTLARGPAGLKGCDEDLIEIVEETRVVAGCDVTLMVPPGRTLTSDGKGRVHWPIRVR
jgi:hypothetical protein